jgi:hypothetical protein
MSYAIHGSGIAVKEQRHLKTQVTQTLMLLIPCKDNIKKARSLYNITDRNSSGDLLQLGRGSSIHGGLGVRVCVGETPWGSLS